MDGQLELLHALDDAAGAPRDSRPGTRLVAIRLALRTPAVAEITGLERHLVGSDGSLDPDVGGWPP